MPLCVRFGLGPKVKLNFVQLYRARYFFLLSELMVGQAATTESFRLMTFS